MRVRGRRVTQGGLGRGRIRGGVGSRACLFLCAAKVVAQAERSGVAWRAGRKPRLRKDKLERTTGTTRDKLCSLAGPLASERGLEVLDVDFSGEAGSRTVRIYLD